VAVTIISKANINTGYFTEVSPIVTKILGFSVEEFTSRPIMEFIHQDDRQRTLDEISEQLQSKEVASFENRYLCKNGSYKWMAWQGTSADKNGIVTAVGSDITGRKQSELALKESEKTFQIAMEATKDDLYDWDLVTNEIYYSPGWKHMLGYENDELPNDCSVWEKLTEPEDIKRT
jgi:PAS domain S-box-containing protein